jgi:hypothetical protein
MKTMLVSAFILAIMLAWLMRFEMYPATSAGITRAYRLDRWTGQVTLFMSVRETKTFGPVELSKDP